MPVCEVRAICDGSSRRCFGRHRPRQGSADVGATLRRRRGCHHFLRRGAARAGEHRAEGRRRRRASAASRCAWRRSDGGLRGRVRPEAGRAMRAVGGARDCGVDVLCLSPVLQRIGPCGKDPRRLRARLNGCAERAVRRMARPARSRSRPADPRPLFAHAGLRLPGGRRDLFRDRQGGGHGRWRLGARRRVAFVHGGGVTPALIAGRRSSSVAATEGEGRVDRRPWGREGCFRRGLPTTLRPDGSVVMRLGDAAPRPPGSGAPSPAGTASRAESGSARSGPNCGFGRRSGSTWLSPDLRPSRWPSRRCMRVSEAH